MDYLGDFFQFDKADIGKNYFLPDSSVWFLNELSFWNWVLRLVKESLDFFIYLEIASYFVGWLYIDLVT